MDREPRSEATGRALLIAGLMLVAFNLRPALSTLGPILPEVERDTALSAFGASVLSTAPILCLGVFSPVTPWLARRFGAERTILYSMLLIAIGTALRGWMSSAPLFVGSILVGIGIGIVNVLMPGLIKRHFPAHSAWMMGAYTTMLCAGGALAAGVAVPIEDSVPGSWGASFAVWAVPALLSAALWWPQVRKSGIGTQATVIRVRGLWRNPLAWQVSLFMAFQSAIFYASISWLPPILRGRGMSPEDAGIAMSIAIVTQLVASLGVPPLVARARDQKLSALVSELLLGAGIFGFLYAPLWSAWFWGVLFGLGQGALFALALTMIVLRSKDAHTAAQLSSMVQTVGYLIASGGALTAGMMFGAAGGREGVAVLFFLLLAAGSVAGWGAGRNRFVAADTESNTD